MKKTGFMLAVWSCLVAILCCLAFPCKEIKSVLANGGGLVKIVYVGESQSKDSAKPFGNLYNPYETIQDAINGESTTAIKICLISDMVIDATIVIDNKTVTVDGGNYILCYGNSFDDVLFNIGVNGRLIITNLKIDGGNHWSKNQENLEVAIQCSENGEVAFDLTKPIVESEISGKILTSPMFVNNGTLSLLAGTMIEDCYFEGNENVGGDRLIYSAGTATKLAEVIVENVIVSHCVSDGGLFYMAYTDFLIGGASYIVDNVNLGGKVGVFFIENNSVAMMKSGVVIKNNLCFADGASVYYIDDGSNFVLNGGVIRENRILKTLATSIGSTVAVMDATFVMNGGIITENFGQCVSTISFLPTENAKLTLNAGTIDGNFAYQHFGDDENLFVDLLLNGSTITSKDFVLNGNLLVDASSKIENKGVINGNLFVLNSDALIENNGKINGNIDLDFGEIVNNGIVSGEIALYGGIFENNNVLDGRVVASIGEDGEIIGEICGFCNSPTVFENVFSWVEDGYAVVTFDFNGGLDDESFVRRRVLVKVGCVPVFDFNIPALAGKVFYGFNDELSEVLRDVTFFAVYENDRNNNSKADIDEPKYTITFTDGVQAEVVFEDQVYSGLLIGEEMPAFNGSPERIGWRFWGWDKKIESSVQGDVTYVAVWAEVEEEKSQWLSILLIVLQVLGLLVALIPVRFVVFRKYKMAFIEKYRNKRLDATNKDKTESGTVSVNRLNTKHKESSKNKVAAQKEEKANNKESLARKDDSKLEDCEAGNSFSVGNSLSGESLYEVNADFQEECGQVGENEKPLIDCLSLGVQSMAGAQSVSGGNKNRRRRRRRRRQKSSNIDN